MAHIVEEIKATLTETQFKLIEKTIWQHIIDNENLKYLNNHLIVQLKEETNRCEGLKQLIVKATNGFNKEKEEMKTKIEQMLFLNKLHYEKQIESSNTHIKQLETENKKLNAKINKLNKKLTSPTLQKQLQTLKNDIEDNETKLNDIITQINTQAPLLTELYNEIDLTKEEIKKNKAPEKLEFKADKVDNIIPKCYNCCLTEAKYLNKIVEINNKNKIFQDELLNYIKKITETPEKLDLEVNISGTQITPYMWSYGWPYVWPYCESNEYYCESNEYQIENELPYEQPTC
jgi:chromosome segregation ATPase